MGDIAADMCVLKSVFANEKKHAFWNNDAKAVDFWAPHFQTKP